MDVGESYSEGRDLIVGDLPNKRHIVSKTNTVLEGRYDHYTIQQIKLFNLFLAQIDEHTTPSDTWTFKAAQLCALLGINTGSYSRLRETTKGMIRGVEIPKYHDNGSILCYEQISIFTKFSYQRGGLVKVQMHPDALPYLVDWKRDLEIEGASTAYTTYYYDTIRQLSSVAVVSLYELCRKSLNICKQRRYKEYDIPTLRKKLHVADGKYEAFGDLNRYVIKKVVNEINQKTDIEIITSTQKEPGTTKVISVRFDISKTQKNRHLLLDRTSKYEDKILHPRLETFIEEYGVGKKVAFGIQSLTSGLPHADLIIDMAIEMSENQLKDSKNINNIGGYAKTVLDGSIEYVKSNNLVEKKLNEDVKKEIIEQDKLERKSASVRHVKDKIIKMSLESDLNERFEEFKQDPELQECIALMPLSSILEKKDNDVFRSADSVTNTIYGKSFRELNAQEIFEVLTMDLTKVSRLKRISINNIHNQLKQSFHLLGYI
jgi:hypothetical protein